VETVSASDRITELRGDWEQMLGHQLPALPPLDAFLEELPQLFGWLEGTLTVEEPDAYPVGADEDEAWSPPSTIATWRGAPLEVIRFAATNHLLVELGYHGRTRLIEPYSLRRARTGNILLHAMRADGSGHRSYSIGEIASARLRRRRSDRGGRSNSRHGDRSRRRSFIAEADTHREPGQQPSTPSNAPRAASVSVERRAIPRYGPTRRPMDGTARAIEDTWSRSRA
jgi:hypothetical protein